MQIPDFDLSCADGTRLTRDDLQGRPWFIYAARHPGCFVCQHALKGALEFRPEVQALGGDMLVFFNSQEEYTRMWVEQSDLPKDLRVVIDPDAGFYKDLGTIRGTMIDQAKKSLGSLWRARADIGKWRLTPNDMMRMGADVAVTPDGEMAFRHICADPEDRADPRDVVAALAGVTSTPR